MNKSLQSSSSDSSRQFDVWSHLYWLIDWFECSNFPLLHCDTLAIVASEFAFRAGRELDPFHLPSVSRCDCLNVWWRHFLNRLWCLLMGIKRNFNGKIIRFWISWFGFNSYRPSFGTPCWFDALKSVPVIHFGHFRNGHFWANWTFWGNSEMTKMVHWNWIQCIKPQRGIPKMVKVS